MKLPSEVVGKRGPCASCKKVVLVVVDPPPAKENGKEVANDTDRSVAAAQERLSDLQATRARFIELSDTHCKLVTRLDETRKAVVEFYQPFGDKMFIAHRRGELSEIKELYRLLGSQSQIDTLEKQLAEISAEAASGVVANSKRKVRQVAIEWKIKKLQGSLKSLKRKAGKQVIDANRLDYVRCGLTTGIIEDIESCRHEYCEASSDVDRA